MKQKLVAVWDVKARVYFAPHFVRNIIEAARSFSEGIRDKNTNLGKFPDDYQLHQLGEWDDETGRGEFGDAICIAHGYEYREKQPS